MRIPPPVERLVSRVRPVLTPAALATAHSVASILGPGPVVGTPAFRRVLVLAPHPDDETIGAGGTLAILAAAGAAVTAVILTDGERTRGTGLISQSIGRRRTSEAAEACRRLGLPHPRFLGLPDGSLEGVLPELSRRVAAVIAETSPNAVFLPWFGDGHGDHRAVTAALAAAAPASGLMVWGYEVWSPLPANRLVDITAAIDRKRQALSVHVTAARAFDLDAMLGLNRYRSVHGLAGQGYAEAFLVAEVSRYLVLARAVTGPP